MPKYERGQYGKIEIGSSSVISIWLLVGFHPATRSVQSTPADNTRKRVWQYIEKERKKERDFTLRGTKTNDIKENKGHIEKRTRQFVPVLIKYIMV